MMPGRRHDELHLRAGQVARGASDLGAFTLSYLGQTGQITGRALAGTSLSTTWSYLPNTGDRRLAGIDNTGLGSGQYSDFAYTWDAENRLFAIASTAAGGGQAVATSYIWCGSRICQARNAVCVGSRAFYLILQCSACVGLGQGVPPQPT